MPPGNKRPPNIHSGSADAWNPFGQIAVHVIVQSKLPRSGKAVNGDVSACRICLENHFDSRRDEI